MNDKSNYLGISNISRVSIFLNILLIVTLLSGCSSLFPKNVEFFQKKVKEVPVQTSEHKETIKEAAEFVARKSEEAYIQAVKEEVSTNLVYLTYETSTVANSLSHSLGPPLNSWKLEAKLLSEKLDRLEAKLDKKLDNYKENVKELEGSKIEGSGLFRVNYFVYIGGILLFLWILSIAIKIYGTINPAVGFGANILKIPAKLAAKTASQLIKGGESFKERIEEHFEDKEVQKKILLLFRQSQLEAQDDSVKKVVKNIT